MDHIGWPRISSVRQKKLFNPPQPTLMHCTHRHWNLYVNMDGIVEDLRAIVHFRIPGRECFVDPFEVSHVLEVLFVDQNDLEAQSDSPQAIATQQDVVLNFTLPKEGKGFLSLPLHFRYPPLSVRRGLHGVVKYFLVHSLPDPQPRTMNRGLIVCGFQAVLFLFGFNNNHHGSASL